jgi:hypothetical protein
MKAIAMHSVALPSGERVAALELGTCQSASARTEKIATLQLARELGLTLSDTAKMTVISSPVLSLQ